MNKLLILFIFLIPIGASAQYIYSPNTIYMNPPTSGCNGSWALMDSLFCQFPTYNISPLGCATNMTKIGDTLLVDLCSIPCNIYVNGDTGNICLTASVALQIITNIEESNKSSIQKIYPNPNSGNFNIEYTFQQNQTLFITDLTGKIVHQEILISENKRQKIITRNLKKGLYLVVIKNEVGEITFTEKVSIFK